MLVDPYFVDDQGLELILDPLQLSFVFKVELAFKIEHPEFFLEYWRVLNFFFSKNNIIFSNIVQAKQEDKHVSRRDSLPVVPL